MQRLMKILWNAYYLGQSSGFGERYGIYMSKSLQEESANLSFGKNWPVGHPMIFWPRD